MGCRLEDRAEKGDILYSKVADLCKGDCHNCEYFYDER